MSSFKKLWKIFTAKQLLSFVVLFVVKFIGSSLELLSVGILAPFIEVVLHPEAIDTEGTIGEIFTLLKIPMTREAIPLMLVVMIVCYAVKNLYLVFMTYYQYKVVWDSRLEVEGRLMERYINRPYQYLVTKNPAEMQRIIIADTELAFNVLDDMFTLLSEFLTGIMLAIFLLCTDALTTVLIVGLVFAFLFIYFKIFRKRLHHYGYLIKKHYEDGLRFIDQDFRAIKEIKVRGSEEYFNREFVDGQRVLVMAGKRSQFLSQTPKYFLEMLVTCGVLAVLLIRFGQGADAAGMISQLTVFVMAAYRLLPAANRITYALSRIFNNRVSVDAVYESLQALPEENDTPAINAIDSKPDGTGEIRLNGISFRYPGSDKVILEDADLVIKKGTSVALKGASGAGKTTTADLILGILQPGSGTVTFDGENVAELGARWYNHVGYIPQTIYLCDGTIRENVAFGDFNQDDERIWHALREAQLEDFVKGLPEGLDTPVGEDGARISGGQRQRIGIARALYHDPEILILDEATSALDNDTEKAVMESIDYLKGKKTLIIIAHRLTTLQNCDVVYEVKDGKIIAES